MKLIVVGAGPGALEYYTEKALIAIETSDIILTSVRLTEGLEKFQKKVKVLGIMDTIEYIKSKKEENITVCVLASGDVGFYSIATTLRNHLKDENIEIKYINGLSSFQIMSSKIGIAYEDLKLVSLHGKDLSLVPYVSYNKRVFALTGGKVGVKEGLLQLIQSGLTEVDVYIGERLSLKEEKISFGKPGELIKKSYDPLSVMVIINENYVNHWSVINDEDYIRGKTPMTKFAVRNLTMDSLKINPKDIIWDVGAGTGGVSCSMARRAYEGFVHAVEKENEALDLINKNRIKLGAHNVIPKRGTAPAALKDLPKPDKVFLGGTKGNLQEILKIILEKNPKSTIVANAITLETIGSTLQLFKEANLDTETSCVNVAKGKKLGNYNLMMAENPIYIIKGERSEKD